MRGSSAKVPHLAYVVGCGKKQDAARPLRESFDASFETTPGSEPDGRCWNCFARCLPAGRARP